MKFYCKNCGSMFDPSLEFYSWHGKKDDGSPLYCPICQKEAALPIPDYETLNEYKKRTGKPYLDDGLVWVCLARNYSAIRWEGMSLGEVKDLSEHSWPDPVEHIVIADPPVPPPDDWKPKD